MVASAQAAGSKMSINTAARVKRPVTDGLLLIYPISRFSGNELRVGDARRPLFDNPGDALARDLVGIAVSFPHSNQPQHIEAYLEGTVGWRPIE